MSRTSDRTYQRNRKRVLASTDICALCGNWINPELKYPDPGSASADHIDPVALGGHNRGQLQATHLLCNQARYNKPMSVVAPKHGRRW